MIIFILIFNICPFYDLILSWVCSLLIWRNKKWKHTRNGNFSWNWMNPKAPVLCVFVSHEFTRVRLEEKTSSVSRSSQILASNRSPEITCTSWPIWDQGLAHCSSPEHPLGVKATSPLGSVYYGCPQFAPSGNSDFSCCCSHGVQRSSPLFPSHCPLFLSPLSSEILKALHTSFSEKAWCRTVCKTSYLLFKKRKTLEWIFLICLRKSRRIHKTRIKEVFCLWSYGGGSVWTGGGQGESQWGTE